MIKQPMLAASEVPDLESLDWSDKVIQPKLDGIRCVAINGVAYSRAMKLIPNESVQAYFAQYQLHGFDGELMVRGCDFNGVQSGIMSKEGSPDFYFTVYDDWSHSGIYRDRLEAVKLSFDYSDYGSRIEVIDSTPVTSANEASVTHGRFVEEGFEGAIIRCNRSSYKQGRATLRSQSLLKLKSFDDSEAVVIGFEEKLVNNNEQFRDERGYAKRSTMKAGMLNTGVLGALIVKWNGKQFNIGSGFTDEQREDYWIRKNELLGTQVTFKHQSVSAHGTPRIPVFKGFRTDHL